MANICRLRSVERLKKEHGIKTFRRNNGDPELWFNALAAKQDEIDPLRRFGARDLQDALRESHVLIPRQGGPAVLDFH